MEEKSFDVKKKGILSKKLLGRVVVSKSGKKFGHLSDLVFDTKSGEIIDLVLDDTTSIVSNLSIEKDGSGKYLIPFHSVIAVGDFVVVSEEDLS